MNTIQITDTVQNLNDTEADMSGAMEKSLAILEYLANYPDGATLGQIAT